MAGRGNKKEAREKRGRKKDGALEGKEVRWPEFDTGG